MFTSLFDSSFRSPFKAPLTKVQCEPSNEQQQLVVGRSIAAASVADGDSCEFGSTKYFLLCGLGGIISCGSTHTLLTPLDLVKCRLQVDQAKYKNLFTGFRVTYAEDGARGLAKGWAPTAFGYSAQVRTQSLFYIQLLYQNRFSVEHVIRSWIVLD